MHRRHGAVRARSSSQLPGSWRVLLDIGLIGVFGGLFIVPLYALVQQRTRREVDVARHRREQHPQRRSSWSSPRLLGALALQAGLTIPQLLLLTGMLNAFVAIYIYSLVPEFLLRFLAWLLVHFIYRLDTRGIEQHSRAQGPALLICNHVGFADRARDLRRAARGRSVSSWKAASSSIPVLSAIFRGMKAIPVAPAKEDPEVYERAFQIVAAELRDGKLVCIFPEGRLTADGEIGEFRAGMMRILKETPVPVVPMALSGLWDSMFSRKYKAGVEALAAALLAEDHVCGSARRSRRNTRTCKRCVRAVVELRGADR